MMGKDVAVGLREREEDEREAGEGARIQEAVKPFIDLGG